MSDERDWFDAMVAASKEAAGRPPGWGTAPGPLSPEDAVRLPVALLVDLGVLPR